MVVIVFIFLRINLFYIFVLFVKNDNIKLLQTQRQIKNALNAQTKQSRDIAIWIRLLSLYQSF